MAIDGAQPWPTSTNLNHGQHQPTMANLNQHQPPPPMTPHHPTASTTYATPELPPIAPFRSELLELEVQSVATPGAVTTRQGHPLVESLEGLLHGRLMLDQRLIIGGLTMGSWVKNGALMVVDDG